MAAQIVKENIQPFLFHSTHIRENLTKFRETVLASTPTVMWAKGW
jgi:hypothetical protein